MYQSWPSYNNNLFTVFFLLWTFKNTKSVLHFIICADMPQHYLLLKYYIKENVSMLPTQGKIPRCLKNKDCTANLIQVYSSLRDEETKVKASSSLSPQICGSRSPWSLWQKVQWRKSTTWTWDRSTPVYEEHERKKKHIRFLSSEKYTIGNISSRDLVFWQLFYISPCKEVQIVKDTFLLLPSGSS